MLPKPYAVYKYEHAVLGRTVERFKKFIVPMETKDEFVPIHDMKS